MPENQQAQCVTYYVRHSSIQKSQAGRAALETLVSVTGRGGISKTFIDPTVEKMYIVVAAKTCTVQDTREEQE